MFSTMYSDLLESMMRAPLWSSLAIIAAAALTSFVLHVLARSLQIGRYAWQQRLRSWLGIEPGRRIGELSWLVVSIELLLWPCVLYLLLHVWGLHEAGEKLLRTLFSRGFTLGSTRIVIGKLLFGIVLFGVLFMFTRWLKRKLETDWLVRANVEPGTREAAATLFGYATFVIAAITGISFAGVDLGKLAIVDGALSVGIGFGLQNVVRHFVSGVKIGRAHV